MEDGALSVIVAVLGAITQIIALKKLHARHEIALVEAQATADVRVEKAKVIALQAADRNFHTDIESLQTSIHGLRQAWDQDLKPLKSSIDALSGRIKIIEDQPRRSK